MITIICKLLAGLVLGYLGISYLESFLHDRVQHACKSTRDFWKKHGKLFAQSLDAFFSHAIVHHGWTYVANFVTQFRSAAERAAVEARLALRGARGRLIINEGFGNSLAGWGVFMFTLPALPIPVILYIALGVPGLVGALLPLAMYPAASKYLHPYIHMRHADAVRSGPWPIAWLLRRRAVQRIVLAHWMHHRYPNCNFNLLPGGDYLRGVHRNPSREDVKRMIADGMPVGALGQEVSK